MISEKFLNLWTQISYLSRTHKILMGANETETECDYEITLRLCLLHFQVKLNNLHFTYKLDLSRVPCHCNAAAYFNKMPVHSPGEGGDWYCDANYVGGIG